MHYLKRYVGTYRVKAEYDLSTNDFPRLENGNLDPSFDDLYIDCKNNIKIKHGTRNILSCYIPSKSRGVNILRKIHEDYISEDLPKEISQTQKYFEKLSGALVENDVLVSAEVLDYEVYFEFSSNLTLKVSSPIFTPKRHLFVFKEKLNPERVTKILSSIFSNEIFPL